MAKSLKHDWEEPPPMLKGLLSRLWIDSKAERQTAVRRRLHARSMPAALYAIGDIHGRLDLLIMLEQAIAADASAIHGEKWIICLGDYIDRGPESAGVLDHLLALPPTGFRRICLAGNHEDTAFEFLCNGEHDNGWLDFGGRQTLASYGLHVLSTDPAQFHDQLESHIPEAHLAFLGTRPSILIAPGFCFVHAGLDPSLSPASQSEEVMLWSRPNQFVWPEKGTGYRVVHGHTPVGAPDLSSQRINIDLGAYATGRLGAIRITPDGSLSTIAVTANAVRQSDR